MSRVFCADPVRPDTAIESSFKHVVASKIAKTYRVGCIHVLQQCTSTSEQKVLLLPVVCLLQPPQLGFDVIGLDRCTWENRLEDLPKNGMFAKFCAFLKKMRPSKNWCF